MKLINQRGLVRSQRIEWDITARICTTIASLGASGNLWYLSVFAINAADVHKTLLAFMLLSAAGLAEEPPKD